MPRAIVTAQRVFPFIIALTAIIAIMPAQALGWTLFPAEFMGIFLNPFAERGNALAAWLRPPPSSSLIAGMTAEDIKKLLEDKSAAEQQLRSEQMTSESLQKQLEQLQKIPAENRPAIHPIIAPIGMRSSGSAVDNVKLNRGANHGVKPGAVAVFDGDQLLGRVGENVSATQCTLVPLANTATGMMAGVVIANAVKSRPMKIDAVGDGTFTAQVDKVEVVRQGDDVVLQDDAWPPWAQGLKIGVIEKLFTNDMEPLKNTIIIRPRLLVSQVPFVVLKVEQSDSAKGVGGPPK